MIVGITQQRGWIITEHCMMFKQKETMDVETIHPGTGVLISRMEQVACQATVGKILIGGTLCYEQNYPVVHLVVCALGRV